MLELLIRGAGRSCSSHLDTVAELQAWVGHRNRKRAAGVALGNQLPANVDPVFASLQGRWLAFALIRTQTSYDPERFAAAITTQGERRTRTDRPVSGRRATFESDVACPPTTTVTPTAVRRNARAAS
jgi:hypothetical protein